MREQSLLLSGSIKHGAVLRLLCRRFEEENNNLFLRTAVDFVDHPALFPPFLLSTHLKRTRKG
jgi:hypothetical protein